MKQLRGVQGESDPEEMNEFGGDAVWWSGLQFAGCL